MPVRKATIPASITTLESEPESESHPDNTEPIVAPELKAGAKTPPAAPLVNEAIDPSILKRGVYQCTILSEVKSNCVMISFPEFRLSSPEK